MYAWPWAPMFHVVPDRDVKETTDHLSEMTGVAQGNRNHNLILTYKSHHKH